MKATLGETESQKEKTRQSHQQRERKNLQTTLYLQRKKANGGRKWHRGYPVQWLLWCLALRNAGTSSGFAEKTKGPL